MNTPKRVMYYVVPSNAVSMYATLAYMTGVALGLSAAYSDPFPMWKFLVLVVLLGVYREVAFGNRQAIKSWETYD
jgi:ABC-type multidrug transport system permease subunit